MREIKFRAWNKNIKEMCWVDEWNPTNMIVRAIRKHSKPYRLPCSENHSSIMQYTGIKDKNGVDIYEGDIVNANYEVMIYWDEDGEDVSGSGYYEEAQGEVVFIDCSFRIKDNGTLAIYNEFKIIGNIYENPELLNSEPEDKRSVATEVDSKENDGKING